MESFISLFLGVLTGSLVHFSLPDVFNCNFWKRKNLVDEFVDRKVWTSESSDGSRIKPSRIFIPNMLHKWPWLRRVNPNYAIVKGESDAWLKGLQVFSPKVLDTYIRCDSNLLACLAYPTANKEHVRLACDFVHILFILDEYSDRSAPSEVRKQKDVVMDALLHPHTPRPKGEWIGGELNRHFWERAVRLATKVTQKRFIQYMDEYLEEIIQESIDKNNQRVLDVKSYIHARRSTGAVKAAFSLIELGLGLDIPDEVVSHPTIQEMILIAIDIISFSNDIVSYNLERLRGDDLHNIITCIMNEHNTDVNGAILWVANYLHVAEERFCEAMASLPQWEEPLNSQVREYCNGLGYWVRANDVWNFESSRYFGEKGPEIKENRWISLFPKKRTSDVGPVQIDSSLFD